MYRLQISQLVVVCVDAHAEEETRVPPVDYLERAELDKVGLVLLVSGSDEAVDLAVEGREFGGWGRGGSWPLRVGGGDWEDDQRGCTESTYLAFELDFLFILGCVRWGCQSGRRERADLRCMEHTISPDGSCLWSMSVTSTVLGRHCMRSIRRWDALPILDQNEGQHHLCDCRLSQIRYVKLHGG